MNKSSCVFETIDQTIESGENRLSVKELRETAGVSRSGHYAWVKAAPAREAAEEQDRKDLSLILGAYKVRGHKKGTGGLRGQANPWKWTSCWRQSMSCSGTMACP